MKDERKPSGAQSGDLPGNKMGTLPVPRLLLGMAMPMMLSMIVQALYNVVDSLFVSYIPDTTQIADAGDKAVNALTLAFPIQMLIMALCVGTGVGVNASLARSLGAGNRDQAGRIAGNAMILSLGYYLVTLAFGLFGARAYLESQTSDPVVLEFSFSYLSIITIYAFGSSLSCKPTSKTLTTCSCSMQYWMYSVPYLLRRLLDN